eukprot:3861729-Rhodomonas_salina.1
MPVSRAAPLGPYTGKPCFLPLRGGCTSPSARASRPVLPGREGARQPCPLSTGIPVVHLISCTACRHTRQILSDLEPTL